MYIMQNSAPASVSSGCTADTEHCKSPIATDIGIPEGKPHQSSIKHPAIEGAETTFGRKLIGNPLASRLISKRTYSMYDTISM